MLRKVFTPSLKRFEIRKLDAKNFTVEVKVSDETLDRYDEIILTSAWKKNLKYYKGHPVLLSSHSGRGLMSQIGECEEVTIEEGKGLWCRFKYYVGEGNQEADWGWNLCQKGIAAFSVGFMEIDSEVPEQPQATGKKAKRMPRRIYKEVELLEVSQVLIPANPSAVMSVLLEENGGLKNLALSCIHSKDFFSNHTGIPSFYPEDQDGKGTTENQEKDLEVIESVRVLTSLEKEGQTLNGASLQQIIPLVLSVANLTARTIRQEVKASLLTKDIEDEENDHPGTTGTGKDSTETGAPGDTWPYRDNESPEEEDENEDDTKHCPGCQMEVKSGWVVCPQCQKSLVTTPPTPSTQKEMEETQAKEVLNAIKSLNSDVSAQLSKQ